MPAAAPASSCPAPAAASPAYPLDEFYALTGLPLPAVEQVPGERVPEPYRALLVHSRDMTPTLEHFHGTRIHLQVLRSFIRGEHYYREVVLRLDGSGQPVEFGANRVNLNLFSCTARRLILEEHVPLGTILKDFAISHANHPQDFLRVTADKLIRHSLHLNGASLLYARHNLMLDPQRRVLSEVVEVLPPFPEHL